MRNFLLAFVATYLIFFSTAYAAINPREIGRPQEPQVELQIQNQIPPPTITATSAILVEASTGRVIYEKNADEVRPPASLTKMMTCILGLEILSADSEIEATQAAEDTDYSTLQLRKGDLVNSYDLLTGMMLVSDNGGAVAVAENIAGTVPYFSVMMNDKAREIGCVNTNFANPNGLPNPNNYSTARDLSKIAMYCMKNDKFREIVGTKEMMLFWHFPAGKKILCENTNELLYSHAWATGIKTGYTNAAGGCLAASAKRGDVELIAIILNAADMDTRFADAEKIFEYGFGNVKMTRQVKRDRVQKMAFVRGGESATVKISPSEDLVFPLLSGEEPKNLSVTYELPKFLDAGIERGEVVGQAVLKYKGTPVASVPMVARESVAKGFSVTSTIVSLTEPLFMFAESFSASA